MAKIIEKKSEEVAETSSEARVAFAKLLEQYKKQNPAKYEQKKASLLAKLNTL